MLDVLAATAAEGSNGEAAASSLFDLWDAGLTGHRSRDLHAFKNFSRGHA
jgi:hypothetical protein